MKPESVARMKQLLDARDLLRDAREQYEAAIAAFKVSLICADAALNECDEETDRWIETACEFVESLPRGPFDAFDALAETLEARAAEVTAAEDHVPAGVS